MARVARGLPRQRHLLTPQKVAVRLIAACAAVEADERAFRDRAGAGGILGDERAQGLLVPGGAVLDVEGRMEVEIEPVLGGEAEPPQRPRGAGRSAGGGQLDRAQGADRMPGVAAGWPPRPPRIFGRPALPPPPAPLP